MHAILMGEQMRLEPERMKAEARFVARMDWKRRDAYLQGVAKQRGLVAAEALRAAAVEVQK